MSNIRNKALRQEGSRKENIGEAAKRIAAIVLSVGVMLGVSGCSTNVDGNVDVSDADVSSLVSSTSCDSQNLEEWNKAKEEVKQDIESWLRTNVTSPERLWLLWNTPESVGFKSLCAIDDNNLSNYGVKRALIEIPERIKAFFEALDSVDASKFDDKSEIEEEIQRLLQEHSIIINKSENKVEIHIEDIPILQAESPTEKEKYYSVTDGLLLYVFKNGSIFENESFYEYFTKLSDGSEKKSSFTTEYLMMINRTEAGTVSHDVVFVIWTPGDAEFMGMSVDGKEVDIEEIRTEDVLRNYAFIYGDDPKFQELCENLGVSINN